MYDPFSNNVLGSAVSPYDALLGNYYSPPAPTAGGLNTLGPVAGGLQAATTSVSAASVSAASISAASLSAASVSAASTPIAAASATQTYSASDFTAPTKTLADGSTLVGAAGGLQFDLVWDSSVSSAPSGFKSAAIAAASFYANMFSNPMTIEIDVGWGEENGSPISSGDVGESSYSQDYFNYSDILPALKADASFSANQATADATLPATDPLGASFYVVNTAEATALGLDTGGYVNGYADGYVGISSKVSWDWNSQTTAVGSKQYDAIGTFLHEMSMVMGRIGSVGEDYGDGVYSPLDLFRYTSPGVRDTVYNTSAAYFSINSGATNLGTYNNPATGTDAGDWASSLIGDSYGWARPGIAGVVSANDLVEDSVLGYNLTAAGLAATKTAGLA